MAKRKKSKNKKKSKSTVPAATKDASLDDVIGVVRSPAKIYKCLECGHSDYVRYMLTTATVGDHEMPNGRVKPGNIHVKAPVCRRCLEGRQRDQEVV